MSVYLGPKMNFFVHILSSFITTEWRPVGGNGNKGSPGPQAVGERYWSLSGGNNNRCKLEREREKEAH